MKRIILYCAYVAIWLITLTKAGDSRRTGTGKYIEITCCFCPVKAIQLILYILYVIGKLGRYIHKCMCMEFSTPNIVNFKQEFKLI